MNNILSQFKRVKYLRGDYALDNILTKANIEKADHAIILSNSDKYNDAIEELTQVLVLYPDYKDTYYYLGYSYLMINDEK